MNKFFILIASLLLPLCVLAQKREFKIHDRGMIHETVYNTGTIGRPLNYSNLPAETTELPLMEWPPFSKTVIKGIEYSGQHNIIGAGVYLAANEKGKPGWPDRLFAFCGGIGTGSGPELPFGRWSFPISMEEIENFPFLDDGTPNPEYNPDEAEEIIIAKWSTNVGITITRTSRAWSHPDYDDMIIYEYELEYTGDTDGDLTTIERTADLVDVIFTMQYGFAPSMLGYQRSYGEWKYEDGMWRQDQRSSFDPDYFLTFMQDVHTGAPDAGAEDFLGKPEPDKDLFLQFASTGQNGGGLLSPQAPGYCWLHWDTTHLAIADPTNLERNETEYISGRWYLKDDQNKPFEIDENDHIKQPWQMKTASGNTRVSKMEDRAMTMDERWWTVYGEPGVLPGLPSDGGRYIIPGGRSWLGRARYEWDESYNGVCITNGMGPYVLKLGEKIEFAVAEVVGYGGTPGKVIAGGQRDRQFFAGRDLNKKVVINGEVLTEHYLDDFGYPDYINSDVITVNQVAHKAWEAYLGRDIPYDSEGYGPAEGMLWPEDSPSPSQNSAKYHIPMRVPAPVMKVENTQNATVELTWGKEVENFTHPRLESPVVKYNIYRSEFGAGPWKLLGSLNVGEINSDDKYVFEDSDDSFNLGESKYYSVTSVDNNGNESGRTNTTFHAKDVKSLEKLGFNLNSIKSPKKVYAIPNPFYLDSGFESSPNQIGFYGLTEKCTIRIFSYSGQLVKTIEHNDPVFSTAYFQVSRNNQEIAPGIYFYVVSGSNGDESTGKLVIVK